MWNQTSQQPNECEQMQPFLSEYNNNMLTAREVWEVEKHLAICKECAAYQQEMLNLLQVLAAAPRQDTNHDFMASLHARLDTIEQERARSLTPWEAVCDWVASLKSGLFRHPVSTFGLGAVATASIMVIVFSKLTPVPVAPTANVALQPTQAVIVKPDNLTRIASNDNPFADPAADALDDQISITSPQREARPH